VSEREMQGKQAMRKRLAALSFTEKIKILEKLRDRDRAIAAAGLRGSGERGANDEAAKDNQQNATKTI
jgi:hypothetical protein